MACNASKVPMLRVIAKRGYSASACPRPVGQAASVQTKQLDNKVVVASAEAQLPVTRVSVVFGAGSRHESYDTQGATHMLRVAGGLTNKNSSGFAVTRNLQQKGGNLTVTSDREVVAYTVETTANNLECGLHYLQDVIQPAFKPWELADSVPFIKNQVACVPHQVQAVELLHKAAFRNGLGNSVYVPKFQIGKLSSETMLHYVANNFNASRCAVVGVGVDQNALVGFAQSLELATAGKSGTGSNYYGGDARKDTPGNMAHVAVAGPGGAVSNQKEALAFAVLQCALGAGPATKRGAVNGPFGKALSSALGDANARFAALNASYADAGLFGFVVSTEAQNAGKAVDALTRALKSGSVSAEDVNRGKALLKVAVLDAYSTDSSLIAEMGLQAVLTKDVQSADALVSAIDGVTQQDVQSAAKKAGSSKLSVGAVGNLAHVPYASDLA
ncbi:ubiquinol-cytochrome c reductase core protein 2 [Haematobia irritans]|uniref:Putative ubiquinol cytochrome c reductase subunit qcr2 n=2 Tax=Haematobia irritans TaxID=7368 RepID=A0A1L8EEM6_HAEIR